MQSMYDTNTMQKGARTSSVRRLKFMRIRYPNVLPQYLGDLDEEESNKWRCKNGCIVQEKKKKRRQESKIFLANPAHITPKGAKERGIERESKKNQSHSWVCPSRCHPGIHF